MPDTPCYRIQTVAEMTGIPASTLRAWERRYGVPSPERTSAAYRLYSEADVALLRRMKQLTDSGVAPAEAVLLLRSDEPEAPAVDPTQSAFDFAHTRMLAAVERYDAPALRLEASRACYLGRATDVYEGVLAPTMRAVGEGWLEGRISVAQEHLASEVLLGLARDLNRLVQPEAELPLAMLACVEGELHSMPLYGLALRMASWQVRSEILGASTPPDALADAADALAPKLVALSITIPLPPSRLGPTLDAYARACAGRPWIVGGPGAVGAAPAVEARGGALCPGDRRRLRALVHQLVASSADRPGAAS